jgi:hypothetical protein
MGRGGYNGGDPSVSAPKTNRTYIWATNDSLDLELLGKSYIAQSGEKLENEEGGVQGEFGYILRPVNEAKQSKSVWTKLRSRGPKKSPTKEHFDVDSSFRSSERSGRGSTSSRLSSQASESTPTVGLQAGNTKQ